MNKITGSGRYYAPVRETRTEVIVSYGLETVTTGGNATWYEVSFNKKANGRPSLQMAKAAVNADINERTANSILNGLAWNGKPVWLSTENQQNWKAAYDRAVQTEGANLPLKFKLGENVDGEPIYHTFTSLNAFGDFWGACLAHIQQCLQDGWTMKDSIDWTVYELTNG